MFVAVNAVFVALVAVVAVVAFPLNAPLNVVAVSVAEVASYVSPASVNNASSPVALSVIVMNVDALAVSATAIVFAGSAITNAVVAS